jgi:WD40 repeat protein
MPDSRSLLALAALAFLVSCTPPRPTDETPTGQVETPAPSATAVPSATPTAAPTVEISPSPTTTVTPRPFELITLPSSYEGPLPDGALAQFGYGNLNAASVSPQGTYVALGTSSSVVLFHTDTLEQVWTFPVTTYINYFAWTDDESRLAAGSRYRDSVVLDIAAGEQLFTFSPQDHWLDHLAWTPDARLLVGATRDGYVMVWDGSSGVLLRQMRFEEAPPSDYHPDVTYTVFSLSPDGRYAAAAYLYPETGSCCIPGDNVVIWDVNSGAQLHRLAIDDQSDYLHGAADLAWSPDSSTLAVGGNGIQFWDVASGQQQGETLLFGGNNMSIQWSPDGTKLALLQGENSLILDTTTRQMLFKFAAEWGEELLGWSADSAQFAMHDWGTSRVFLRDSTTGRIQPTPSVAGGASAFTPDFKRFFLLTGNPYDYSNSSGEPYRSLVEWDAETRTSTTILTGTRRMWPSAFLSPDGRQAIALVGQTNVAPAQLLIWDIAANRAVVSFPISRSSPSDLTACWSPDGSALAVDMDSLFVYDISTWELILSLRARSFDCSPTSGHIAVSYASGFIVYDMFNRDVVLSVERNRRGTVQWSLDGERIAFVSDDGQFEILDSHSGEVLESWTLPADDGYISHARVSPDLSLLATRMAPHQGDSCDEVKIWSTETGELLRTLPIEEYCNFDDTWLPWLPDSSALVLETSSDVALYDPRTGARLVTLPAIPDDFSPDGQFFVSSINDTIILWEMPD